MTNSNDTAQNNAFNGYALLVGIADYWGIRDLPPTVLNDVDGLNRVLVDPDVCAYPAENVRVLKDDAATAVNILAGLDWLAQKADVGDTAVIYFSGHGGRVETTNGDVNYLLPVDARFNKYQETAISSDTFSAKLRQIPSEKVVVFLDCCHAGGIGTAKTAVEFQKGLGEATLEKMRHGTGRAIIASSRADEVSLILTGAENSLFTTHLLAGLKGEAADNDGFVKITNLFEYVETKVNQTKPAQQPLLKAELEHNFVIAAPKTTGVSMSTIAQSSATGGSESKNLDGESLLISGRTEVVNEAQEQVLRQLFAAMYEEIVIRRKLTRGWSGALVLEIRPFKPNNPKPLSHVIVKIDKSKEIEKEWQRYEAVIKDQIPLVAGPMREPAYANKLGGLVYPMAGDGLFAVKSLGERFHELPAEKLEKVIDAWLFPALKKLWGGRRQNYNYSVRAGFASWLGSAVEDDFAKTAALLKTALETINPKDPEIKLSDRTTLQNPFADMDSLLDEIIDVEVGAIHGDLNLENIMLFGSQDEFNVRLIDFARAEPEQFVLLDLLCLETGVLVNIMPTILKQHPQPQMQMAELLVTLHKRQMRAETVVSIPPDLRKPLEFLLLIRRFASQYLLNHANWNNYYIGLVLYLIGAVRFESLDDPRHELPRRIAFWSACIINQLRLNPRVFDDVVIDPEAIDTLKFRELLHKAFQLGDLDLLITTAGEKRPDNIPGILDGSSVELRMLYIIQYFERRGWLGDLFKAAQKLRPKEQWQKALRP